MKVFALKAEPAILLETIMANDKFYRNPECMKIEQAQQPERSKWSQTEFLDVSGTGAQRSLCGDVSKKRLTHSVQAPCISDWRVALQHSNRRNGGILPPVSPSIHRIIES